MWDILRRILNWSEVWAAAIPVSILLFRRTENRSLRPVIIYIWLAFLINIAIDAIMAINMYFKYGMFSNNFLYNVQSVVRFACFSLYFFKLHPTSFVRTRKIIALTALGFLIINFLFFEKFINFYSFSDRLLTAEAYLLLVYCMLYYLTELKSDRDDLFRTPHFWVVTGLCIYVVVNFYVFLFYMPMLDLDLDLAVNFWHVHNIAFIIFCLFITKAFYGPVRYKYSV